MTPEPFFRQAHPKARIELVIPRPGGAAEIILISHRQAFDQLTELLRMVRPVAKFDQPG